MKGLRVMVNGEERSFAPGATVEDVVRELQPSPRGIAVACNGEVVPRSRWGSTSLVERDRLEVLVAAQGG